MINNVVLRRVSNIFDFSDEKICAVFKLGQCDISTDLLKKTILPIKHYLMWNLPAF